MTGRGLADLKNIGEKTVPWLNEIGVFTVDDLEALGAVETYKRLKQARPREVTLLALYALQGALLDIHWNDLPPDMKADLKAQAES